MSPVVHDLKENWNKKFDIWGWRLDKYNWPLEYEDVMEKRLSKWVLKKSNQNNKGTDETVKNRPGSGSMSADWKSEIFGQLNSPLLNLIKEKKSDRWSSASYVTAAFKCRENLNFI